MKWINELIMHDDGAGRMWCHCRMVYLPMSYLYGQRFVGPINGIVLSLRRELYTFPYHLIDWDQARNLCAKVLRILSTLFVKEINKITSYTYNINCKNII